MSERTQDKLEDALHAAREMAGGIRSCFEFARARLLQQMSRLLVMDHDQEIIGEMRELGSCLALYTHVRKLALRAALLETPTLKLWHFKDKTQFEFEYPEDGIYVDEYKVERGKAGVRVTLVSPMGFNVRLILPPNVSEKLREEIRRAESKWSPSEDNRR